MKQLLLIFSQKIIGVKVFTISILLCLCCSGNISAQMYLAGGSLPAGSSELLMYYPGSGINDWNLNVYLSDYPTNEVYFKFYTGSSYITIGGFGMSGTGVVGGTPISISHSGMFLVKINPTTYEYSITDGKVGINTLYPHTGLDVYGGFNSIPYTINVNSSQVQIPDNVNTVLLIGSRPDSVLVNLPYYPVNGFRVLIQNWAYPKSVIQLYNETVTLFWGESAEFLHTSYSWQWTLISKSKNLNKNEVWNLTGNSGTNPNWNFIGTNDNTDLVMITGNEERLRISSDGNVGIGTEGSSLTGQETKFNVTSNDIRQTGYFKNLPGTNTNYTGNSYALYGSNESHRNGVNYGGYFSSIGNCSSCIGSNVGLYAYATGGNGNIGLVAKSENSNDLAAHFQTGKVQFDNNIGIRLSPASNSVLKLDKPISLTYGANFLFENGTKGNVIIGNGNVFSGGFAGLTVTAGQGQQYANDLAIVAMGRSLFMDELAIGVQGFTPGYKLAVDGKIIAEELRIQNSIDWAPWPDYVFEKEYKLRNISELEKYLNENKHLPEVPSAKNIKDDGIVIGDMQITLLKKIEELTLYIIDQQKQIDELKKMIIEKAK